MGVGSIIITVFLLVTYNYCALVRSQSDNGHLKLSQEIEFKLISETPLKFSLKCITAGGPATTVQWTRNGVSLVNGGSYEMTQTLVDGNRSTYSNQLTVLGRYPGVYNVTISNPWTPHPVTSHKNITDEEPPIDFELSLAGADGIEVSWTAAASASRATLYVICLETNDGPRRKFLVRGLARPYIIRGLDSGSTYSISMIVRSDLNSSIIGPKEIVIGIPESLTAVPGSVSIRLSWKPPSDNQIIRYDIRYRDSSRQSKIAIVNGDTLQLVLTDLIPEETYTIQVRASTTSSRGGSAYVTTSTLPLSVIQNVRVEKVLDVSTIRLSWDQAREKELVDHYIVHYTLYSNQLKKPLEEHTKIISGSKTSEEFYMPGAGREQTEHIFQVSFKVHTRGEEIESEKTRFIFNFDAKLFQLKIAPVDSCMNWDDKKADMMENSIQKAVTSALETHCNCTYPPKYLRTGKFRCWTSKSEVTYRTAIIGTAAHTSLELLGCIESWVTSKTGVVDVGKVSLQVLSKGCPVEISSMNDEECYKGADGGSGD